MNRFSSLFLALIIALLLAVSGCSWAERLDNLEAATFRPDLAVPLLSTDVGADRLFDELGDESRFIRVDPDGLVVLVYEDSLYTLDLGDSLAIADFSVPMPLPTIDIPLSVLSVPAIELADIKTGRLRFDIQTPTNEPYRLELTLNNVQRNGSPITMTRDFNDATYVLPAEEAESLANGRIDFIDGDIEASYVLTNQNTGVSLPAQSLNLFFENLTFSYVQGNFAQAFIEDDLQIETTEDLGRLEGVEFAVRGARLVFDIDNSIGVPVILRLGQFTATNSRTNQTLNLMKPNHPLVSGQVIAYPSLSQVGTSQQDSVFFDDSNANIQQITTLLADQATIEYVAGVDDGTGFITDSSRLQISARTEVPLDLRAKGLSYQDTADFDFDWPELEEVERVELKFITENGLPLELICQVFFHDSTGQVVDSLLDENDVLLEAAMVDAAGEVTSPSSRTLLIDLPPTRYERISRTQQVSFRLGLETSEQGNRFVRFTDRNQLGLKLGVRTTFAADLNDL